MTIVLHLFLLFFSPLPFLKKEAVPVPATHPFYVSVTEVTQNVSVKSLEVSCKFFIDDFEETLRNAYKVKLDIASAQDKATFDRLIPDYINRRLYLVADGRPLVLSYIGYETDKESVYCYFEIPNTSTVKQLLIGNSLLHDFKNEQINIMHVTINGRRQSTKLDFPAKQASFGFN
jgi:hypothetical protein